LRSIVGLLVLSCVVGSCDSRTRRPPPSPGESIAVLDHADRTVQLDSAARRIVSLMPAVTDMVLALGAQDRLIARTDFDVDPRIANLPSTGNALTPSLEWLTALKPDLVITWPDQPTRPVVSRLSELGIPVYAAITESIADVTRTTRDLGMLLGLEARADSMVRSLEADFAAIGAAIASRPDVSVVYLLSLEPPMAAGPGTYINELIELAGGRNVYADVKTLWPQISLEELLRRNPAAIVIAREQGSDPLGRMRQLPVWRNLDAVRNARVLVADPNLFNRPGPGLPDAARRLAKFLHPDAQL
jgi:iron complex transport system substrate-binding protein